MGQACCCESHDKKAGQQIVNQPTPPVEPFIPALYSEVSGDYVALGASGKICDVCHLNINDGFGRWTSLGHMGCGDVRWDGTAMNKNGSDRYWQYQGNGDFQDMKNGQILRNISADWAQFQRSEQSDGARESVNRQRSFDPRDHEHLDVNPYVRTSAGSPLYDALACGDVRLVRGCFLKRRWEERHSWPMRQDIPESGFWPAADACHMWQEYGPVYFLALSYSWLHPTLNDPDMWHLERVARIVDEFHASTMARFLWFRLQGDVNFTATRPPEDIGFFIDFCSLPQQNAAIGIVRSEKEQRQFVAGLGVADIIYGHVATTVIRLTSVPPSESRKYGLRGWPSFEESVSNAKPGYHFRVFTFGDTFSPGDDASHSIEILSNYSKGQSPPQTPQQFQAKLQRQRLTMQQSSLKLELFSNSADEGFVLMKYRDVWAQIIKSESLAYRLVDWGKTEALQLASVLPYFLNLKSLVLTNSAIGSDGLLAIFRCVPATIEHLTISDSAGADAANGIAAELPRLTALRELDLSYCTFGDDGVQAMANHIPNCLHHLELFKCGFTGHGAIAIVQLLSHLRILVIGGNDLGGMGADALVGAISRSPIEKLIMQSANLSNDEKQRFRSTWAAAQKRQDWLLL